MLCESDEFFVRFLSTAVRLQHNERLPMSFIVSIVIQLPFCHSCEGRNDKVREGVIQKGCGYDKESAGITKGEEDTSGV